MDTAETTIRQLVRENRPRELVDYFVRLDPKERRRLHPVSKALLVESRLDRTGFTPGIDWRIGMQSRALAHLVFLCTATTAEVSARKSLPEALVWLEVPARGSARTREAPVVLELVEKLRPAWTNALVELALNGGGFLWDLILPLVQRGLCDRPRHPEFFLRSIRSRLSSTHEPGSLAARAIAEAGWLAPMLYEGFLLPGAEKLQRGDLGPLEFPWTLHPPGTPPTPQEGWHEAIHQLCARGLLDRERMTETIFGALAMHAKPSIAKWLTELFDLLWPEPAAQRAWIRHGDLGFLSALHAPAPGVAAWALRHLESGLESGDFAPHELLEAMEPVMLKDHKTVLGKGLATLRKIVRKDHSLGAAAAIQASRALLLADVALQERVLDFIEAAAPPADPEVRRALGSYADSVLPSLRSRFLPWMGEALLEAAATEVAPDEIVPPPDPLAEENRLPPIADLDEFISLLSHWYHERADTDLLHRLLGAFGALNASPVAERKRRAEALSKLLESDYKGGSWTITGNDLAPSVKKLITGWLEPQTLLERAKRGLGDVVTRLARTVMQSESLFSDYARMIGRAVARQPERAFQLLSTPTHRGGWIDPRELVTRLAVRREPSEPLDLTLALLRLGPTHREAALAEARRLPGEEVELLRYALGDDAVTPKRDQPLWLAATRARHPRDNPSILQSWSADYDHPDGKRLAEFTVETQRAQKREVKRYWGTRTEQQPPRVRLALVEPLRGNHVLTARYRAEPKSWWANDPAYFDWLLSLWPANRQALYPLVVASLSDYAGASPTQTAASAELVYLRWINLPPHPLGPGGHLALAMALNSTAAPTRQGAAEALYQNVRCGLFDPAEFGRQMAALLRVDFLKLNRVVPILRETAALSPLTSRRVAEALSQALDLRGEPAPRLVNALLELMIELRAQHPDVALCEASRQTLQSLGATGKTAQLASRLLASP